MKRAPCLNSPPRVALLADEILARYLTVIRLKDGFFQIYRIYSKNVPPFFLKEVNLERGKYEATCTGGCTHRDRRDIGENLLGVRGTTQMGGFASCGTPGKWRSPSPLY